MSRLNGVDFEKDREAGVTGYMIPPEDTYENAVNDEPEDHPTFDGPEGEADEELPPTREDRRRWSRQDSNRAVRKANPVVSMSAFTAAFLQELTHSPTKPPKMKRIAKRLHVPLSALGPGAVALRRNLLLKFDFRLEGDCYVRDPEVEQE